MIEILGELVLNDFNVWGIELYVSSKLSFLENESLCEELQDRLTYCTVYVIMIILFLPV